MVATNMASSSPWIEELFPPKFKMNDLCDNEQTKPTRPPLSESIQKIYEEVFVEMFSTRKDKDASEHRQGQADQKEGSSHSLVGSKVTTCREPSKGDKSKLIYDEKTSEETLPEGKCMWNAQELKVLRNSLKCSKLNNIRLSVLTQALQKDCERVRDMCHEQASEILKLNSKFNEVRKQNKAMKITCKAFKEDAKISQENLEECRGWLEDAVRDKESAELELVQVKHKLQVVQKQNKVLQLELEKQKALQEKLLANQNISLRSLYEKEITDLVKRLEETELYIEKENNEHTITKKALAHLRLHFTGERR